MKNNDKEIESLILNGSDCEKIIAAQKEKEFTDILSEDGGKKSVREINDFTQAPKELLFSKSCTYSVINRNSKTKSYINGMQAESFLGGQNIARQNLLSGKADYFISGDNYVKFYQLKV